MEISAAGEQGTLSNRQSSPAKHFTHPRDYQDLQMFMFVWFWYLCKRSMPAAFSVPIHRINPYHTISVPSLGIIKGKRGKTEFVKCWVWEFSSKCNPLMYRRQDERKVSTWCSFCTDVFWRLRQLLKDKEGNKERIFNSRFCALMLHASTSWRP